MTPLLRKASKRPPILADEGSFLSEFSENLLGCRWRPHPLYSVFTQYDRDYYQRRGEAFLHKYRCLYAVSKTIAPRRIIELGASAGSGADAYLSATPSARYLGIDWFARELRTDDGSLWDPYAIAQTLFEDRGYQHARLLRAELRIMNELPGSADLVVVDAAHDYENEYRDLRLALTAKPAFIFVDDAADETAAKPAISDFLTTDLAGRVAYRVPINYIGGGLVIRLRKPRSVQPERPTNRNRRYVPRRRIAGSDLTGGAMEPSDAEARAQWLICRGADMGAPTRFGAVGRLVRRWIGIGLGVYDRHQRATHLAILDTLRERRSNRSDGRSRF